MDPLQIVGHSGVDAVVALTGAALPPADDPQQEHRLLVLRHQGAAAVTLARVLLALDVSGAEHVLGESHAALLQALLRWDPRHFEPPQDVRDGSVLAPLAPAAHRVLADGPEAALGQRSRWQADGDGVRRVDDGRCQAKKGDVIVGGPCHVVLVHEDLRDLEELLRALVHLSVVLA